MKYIQVFYQKNNNVFFICKARTVFNVKSNTSVALEGFTRTAPHMAAGDHPGGGRSVASAGPGFGARQRATADGHWLPNARYEVQNSTI